MTSSQTEVGYNTKIEGDVIVTKVDAVLNWFRKKFTLAHAYGFGLLRD
jgi:hypothetical protein